MHNHSPLTTSTKTLFDKFTQAPVNSDSMNMVFPRNSRGFLAPSPMFDILNNYIIENVQKHLDS